MQLIKKYLFVTMSILALSACSSGDSSPTSDTFQASLTGLRGINNTNQVEIVVNNLPITGRTVTKQ